jgi:hypothetical protein
VQMSQLHNLAAVPIENFPVLARETGEWWPLLTVETEMNGDSRSKNERGPSLVGLLGFS